MKSYDFKQVGVYFGGVQIQGFADGDAINVEPDADTYSEYVGSDGEVTRSKTNNKLSRATLTLAQSSESNPYLQGALSAGTIAPFMIKDGSGNTLHIEEQAYVKRQPNSGFGRDVGAREWIIVCPNMLSLEGGN